MPYATPLDEADARRHAPATQRNREPILAVLERVLPPTGTVLEISSGTGEHAIFLAPRLAPRQWLPSDPDPLSRQSILAWRSAHPTANLHPPLALDASTAPWPIEAMTEHPTEDLTEHPTENPTVALGVDLAQHPITAIVNINMIHIAPWEACLGLMAGAGRLLPKGGVLYLYGPFKQGGQHTAPSNAAFDDSLQAQNPAWGVRDLETVIAEAEAVGLRCLETVAMPANNLSVVFQA
ncbi:hypothetical protein GFS31_04310 [Leptolyngbya sp. BL0902]|uniref:DUF938 domain-containing protein n=1 Tax=Leptolyngbya sp. BL0902 TaxID=1115757 RepID=UPI0018E6F315|nr:DUF938 domain-containing protein [Leptolyngbya sp. BL0902]QQE63762.1 hypothetical protein GFS31_04310 [Leptolyngbya sp. BL0902]